MTIKEAEIGALKIEPKAFDCGFCWVSNHPKLNKPWCQLYERCITKTFLREKG